MKITSTQRGDANQMHSKAFRRNRKRKAVSIFQGNKSEQSWYSMRVSAFIADIIHEFLCGIGNRGQRQFLLDSMYANNI